jgi:hypothetical protein
VHVFCHPERGTRSSERWVADEFRAALLGPVNLDA